MTSVWGIQAYGPCPMAMMAPNNPKGHDLPVGAHPSHMHHKQSPLGGLPCAEWYKCWNMTSVWGIQAYGPCPMAMMAPNNLKGHDLMRGAHPSEMHHKQSPLGGLPCAEWYKCCIMTSVWGIQAYGPCPMAMMALNNPKGHDLLVGAHPSHMHHKQSPLVS